MKARERRQSSPEAAGQVAVVEEKTRTLPARKLPRRARKRRKVPRPKTTWLVGASSPRSPYGVSSPSVRAARRARAATAALKASPVAPSTVCHVCSATSQGCDANRFVRASIATWKDVHSASTVPDTTARAGSSHSHLQEAAVRWPTGRSTETGPSHAATARSALISDGNVRRKRCGLHFGWLQWPSLPASRLSLVPHPGSAALRRPASRARAAAWPSWTWTRTRAPPPPPSSATRPSLCLPTSRTRRACVASRIRAAARVVRPAGASRGVGTFRQRTCVPAHAYRAPRAAAPQVGAALDAAEKAFGRVNCAVNCAGIAPPSKVVSRKGPHSLELFNKVLAVNCGGTFNVTRLSAARMVENDPDERGERGCVVNTARCATRCHPARDGRRPTRRA